MVSLNHTDHLWPSFNRGLHAMKEIREDCPGRGLRNTGFRSRPGIAVEPLEPRLLLSLTAVGQPVPHDAPAVVPLQIVEVAPIDLTGKLGSIPVEDASTATTWAAPEVPGAQADDFASLAVDKGQM